MFVLEFLEVQLVWLDVLSPTVQSNAVYLWEGGSPGLEGLCGIVRQYAVIIESGLRNGSRVDGCIDLTTVMIVTVQQDLEFPFTAYRQWFLLEV